MTRLVASVCIAALVMYAGAGAALWFFQRALLFANDKTDLPPAAVGLPDAEVHRLATADHVSLVSWLLRNDGDSVVIYFHGNGGSLASRGDRIQQLAGLGLSVLAVDYRGFGGSEGAPSEAGLYLDAEAAYDFATGLGYRPERILLYGESLGSGVAASLASRRAVAAVVLDAAYSSLADVATDRYPLFPVRLMMRDPFQADACIGSIDAPILMLHGTDDRVVPIRYGRALFAKAGPRASFVEIAGGGHMVLDEAEDRVAAWLKPLLALPIAAE